MVVRAAPLAQYIDEKRKCKVTNKKNQNIFYVIPSSGYVIKDLRFYASKMD